MKGITAGLLLLALAATDAAPALAQAEAVSEGKHYEIAPATVKGGPDMPVRGPAQAKGVVVWSHGRGINEASEKAPPLVLLFAERGWDVVSVFRAWGTDNRRNATLIVGQAAEKMRALGYKRVVLMGQSAGAYASVEAVRYDYPADAVIALAPAAFGSYSGANAGPNWRENHNSLRSVWERYENKKLTVVAAYFTGDDFYEERQPNERGPWLQQALRKFGLPHMVISQPDNPPLTGHSAGQSWTFARRFAPCIYTLVETGTAPPCGDEQPELLKTFGIRRLAASAFDTREPLAGTWFGNWSGGRVISIPILRRQGDRLQARYITGASVGEQTDRVEDLDWPITDAGGGLLVRDLQTLRFEFRQDGPDRLQAKRIPKDGREVQTAVLRRIPPK
ncbi:alpha/beta hydrolase [Ferrovibrio sp.]|uniref:alpha/beta hydrolase n=1 Tax=Ferrovibrio sp. TaxID=1917215 RepID=UPI003D0DF15A